MRRQLIGVHLGLCVFRCCVIFFCRACVSIFGPVCTDFCLNKWIWLDLDCQKQWGRLDQTLREWIPGVSKPLYYFVIISKTIRNFETNFCTRQHICYRNSVCPSVRLSVTRVDQSKTVEVRIMQFSPYSSPIPLAGAVLALARWGANGGLQFQLGAAGATICS